MNGANPKVAGVILAAGTSQRLPPAKLLLPWRGKPVLAHVLEGAKASSFHKLVLVLGHQAGEARAALRDQLHGVQVVENTDYARGRSTSVRAGVQALSEPAHLMFLLGDMPLISTELVNLLLSRFRENTPLLCFPAWRGQRGHPVIYHQRLLPELLTLTGDRTGNDLIRSRWGEALRVELPDFSSQLDLDTENDYHRLCSLMPSPAPATLNPPSGMG